MNPLIEKVEAAHAELERMTRAVAESIRRDDRHAMHDDFAMLERQLHDHMAWEERHVLPEYARQLPESAARLRGEHAELRARLADIGVAIDLHCVRAGAFDELADQLASHAHHENLVYRTVSGEREGGRYHRLLSVLKHLPMVGG